MAPYNLEHDLSKIYVVPNLIFRYFLNNFDEKNRKHQYRFFKSIFSNAYFSTSKFKSNDITYFCKHDSIEN